MRFLQSLPLEFQEISVYFHFISKPLKLFALAALLTLLWTHAAAHSQVASAASTALTASKPAAAFRSAFENYQPHTNEKIISWKEANDNTGRIGGWRAYAKEAELPAQEPAQAPQQPAVGPINAPAPKPDPHAGHGKP